jgi:MSHA biogenesis protein MshK
MAKTLTGCLYLLFGMLPLLAQAQALRDPTQPPAAFTAPVNAAGGEMAEGEAAPGRVLQSVIRRHGARPVAMINGQSIKLGEKIDDFVLVKLTETQATLKGPGGTEILVLSPSVEKTPVRPVRVVR